MTTPEAPEGDDKDWTWVIERPCPDCGFDPREITFAELPELLRASAGLWQLVLVRPEVGVRPAPQVWSPLEYGAHCRDVYRLFGQRAELMLQQDEPRFANWDQDVTAIEKRYWESDPALVSGELADAAAYAAGVFGSIRPDQLERRGLRSNGSEFTLRTLGIYFFHDIAHHLHDVADAS